MVGIPPISEQIWWNWKLVFTFGHCNYVTLCSTELWNGPNVQYVVLKMFGSYWQLCFKKEGLLLHFMCLWQTWEACNSGHISWGSSHLFGKGKVWIHPYTSWYRLIPKRFPPISTIDPTFQGLGDHIISFYAIHDSAPVPCQAARNRWNSSSRARRGKDHPTSWAEAPSPPSFKYG